MAAYVLKYSTDSVQVITPQITEAIVYCTIQTIPSQVIASYPVMKDEFTQGASGPILSAFADAIEEAMSHQYIIYGVGAQKTDDNGLIQDYVVFTVQYPNTATTRTGVNAEAWVPVQLLNYGDAAIGAAAEAQVHDIINQTYAALAAAAAG